MGGMAEVYLAKSTGASGVNKFVAMKRILPQYTENPEFIEMFKEEAKIAVNLSHSNIVSIFEFGTHKEQFFLVMDYVEGRNLRQILNKMKKSNLAFSIEQVLYIIKEVAGGMDHAHRCLDANTGKPLNIIHRDMSPQNVMVSFEGEVKIVDFGIAKAETQIESTRAGMLKGKFGYMSPEQSEGLVVDLRTDVFSLGIVLWELLANDRLFVANNEINTLRKLRECQIPSLRKINPNIPQELERVCNKALARDRNLRYQTAAAFHRELNRFLNRQYPDFSPHDFSIFIKTLFASEILENRKKQIEFAKLISKPPPEEEKALESTSVTGTDSASSVGSYEPTDPDAEPNFVNKEHITNAPPPGFPTATTPTPDAPVNTRALPDFGDLGRDLKDFSRTMPKPPPRAKTKPPPSKKMPVQPRTEELRIDGSTRPGRGEQTYMGHSYSGGTYSGTGPYPGTRSIYAARASAWITNVVIVFLVSGMGTVGYLAMTRPKETIGFINNYLVTWGFMEPPRDFGPQKTELASRPAVPISIWSTPPGAEILIDDKPTGSLTPDTLIVPDGETKNISLRLTGYFSWSEKITVRAGLSVGKELQKARVAYLDISIIGAGDLFINGKKVPADMSTQNYPIPADQEVLIQVLDPVTKASAEAKVNVAENKVRKISLVPAANSRFTPAPKFKK